MKGVTVILFCYLMGACHPRPAPVVPVFLHRPDSLFAGRPDSLIFQLRDTVSEWEFALLTARRPIPLIPRKSAQAWTISLRLPGLFYQGSAAIGCVSRGMAFFFPVQLVNVPVIEPGIIYKNYRSPKTVNPDSNLRQQRMLFDLDRYRNILVCHLKRNRMRSPYFYSDTLFLPALSGTYPVDPLAPITSAYVQPGTSSTLRLSGHYDRGDNCYRVEAGPMKDGVGNIIADGTRVSFVYTSGRWISLREAVSYRGYADVVIPAGTDRVLSIRAKTNRQYSSRLNIKKD